MSAVRGALVPLLACPSPPERDPARAEVVTADPPRPWQALEEGIDGDLGAAPERRCLGPAGPHLRAFRVRPPPTRPPPTFPCTGVDVCLV